MQTKLLIVAGLVGLSIVIGRGERAKQEKEIDDFKNKKVSEPTETPVPALLPRGIVGPLFESDPYGRFSFPTHTGLHHKPRETPYETPVMKLQPVRPELTWTNFNTWYD